MSDRYHYNGKKWEHHWTDPNGYDFFPSEVIDVRPNHYKQCVEVFLENGTIICPDYTTGGGYKAECDCWRQMILDTLPEGTTFPRGRIMKITEEQKGRVKVLREEVYEMLEHTDNHISFNLDENGVAVYAMRGPFDEEKHYEIAALTSWARLDDAWTLDTMRALIRLEVETRRDADDDVQ